LLHHILSICPSHRCTHCGTRRSNHLVEKTFDVSHKYSLKPDRSTIGSDTTCWATVGAKSSGRDFREEPGEGTQDEKTPHPIQNLKVFK
ncbi:hypothetical protein PIB30_100950, partial [Stylosanthes scabra]|nr:hypothetical protein [Stylosanthes scabra]